MNYEPNILPLVGRFVALRVTITVSMPICPSEPSGWKVISAFWTLTSPTLIFRSAFGVEAISNLSSYVCSPISFIPWQV